MFHLLAHRTAEQLDGVRHGAIARLVQIEAVRHVVQETASRLVRGERFRDHLPDLTKSVNRLTERLAVDSVLIHDLDAALRNALGVTRRTKPVRRTAPLM